MGAARPALRVDLPAGLPFASWGSFIAAWGCRRLGAWLGLAGWNGSAQKLGLLRASAGIMKPSRRSSRTVLPDGASCVTGRAEGNDAVRDEGVSDVRCPLGSEDRS